MRKNIIIALFVSLSIVISLLEVLLLPTSLIPGLKIGLANIVFLSVLYLYGAKEMIFVSMLRLVIVSLITGSFLLPSFMMSLIGTILSLLIAILAYRSELFSIFGVSCVSSFAHVTGQVLTASFLLSTTAILLLLPYMLIISIISGLVIASISNIIVRRVKLWK